MTDPRPLPMPPASPPAAEPPANGLPPVARLSELLASPTDRRRFLTRAAALGVTLPSAGALLGCETREHDGTAARSRGTAGTAGAAGTAGGPGQGHAAHQQGGRSNDDAAPAGGRPPDYKVYDAALPPVAPGSRVRIEMVARERKGERVRFYVVNAGPSHPCSFHVVGEQFDTVYLGAPPGNPIHGVQTFMVAPGGGMIFELECDVAGDFPFVNHGFGHGQKGAIGVLRVQ